MPMAMRDSGLQSLGLGSVLDIFTRGQLPASAGGNGTGGVLPAEGGGESAGA